MSAKWEKAERTSPAKSPGVADDNQVEDDVDPVENVDQIENADNIGNVENDADVDAEVQSPENLPGYVEAERENSAASVRSGKLDLEPIPRPKKTNVLKKMNSRGSEPNSKPSSSKSNSSAGSRRRKS